MDLSAAQCRAARGLVDWSQEQLASAAEIGIQTVIGFESGRRVPRASTVAAVRAALESAGVEFSDGDSPGVRLRARG